MADNNNSKKRAGIATLSDLKRSHESDSDSEGPQEYYTGGEKSGMMVQDPSKGNKDVDAIFDRAKQYGAREGAVDARQAPSSSRAAAFTGTGRTLSGQVTEPHSQAQDTAPEPVFHTITFWRNGFTVDDGTIRKLDDPANAPFLQSINNGECPRELEPSNRSIPVHVNLIKRDEEWKPPAEPKHKPFQGTGRTLGNTSDTQASVSVVPIREAAQPFRGISVDELKPFTSLKLRLADGTRMVARFNHHHTVADIRGFIDAARSGGPRSYGLQIMGFPPKLLTDPAQTIEEAGLANAVVIQKVDA